MTIAEIEAAFLAFRVKFDAIRKQVDVLTSGAKLFPFIGAYAAELDALCDDADVGIDMLADALDTYLPPSTTPPAAPTAPAAPQTIAAKRAANAVNAAKAADPIIPPAPADPAPGSAVQSPELAQAAALAKGASSGALPVVPIPTDAVILPRK